MISVVSISSTYEIFLFSLPYVQGIGLLLYVSTFKHKTFYYDKWITSYKINIFFFH
jgi:hypothetical protein